jgi:hypothetical protein
MKIILKRLGFNIVDVISLTVHLLICLFLWVCYNYDLVPLGKIKSWTHAYFFILPLILIGLLFRNLRNLKYYWIWMIIGLIQLIIYHYAKDNFDFFFARGTGLLGLKALLPVLIIFQLLRQISLKVYKQEMIISIRQFRMTFYEEEENRNMTWIEVIFSMILFATSIIFSTV